MRPLRTCDFCADDAVGTFEIVPPELEPTEAEQRRVVLCSDCKGRLEALLEPLLDRAGIEAGSTADADVSSLTDGRSDPESNASADESDSDGESGTVVAAANESTQKRARTSSPNATVSEPDSDGSDETDLDDAATDGTDRESDTDETDSSDTPVDETTDTEDDSKTDSVLEDGITFERSEPTETDDETETKTADEAEINTEDDPAADTETAADESADQAVASRPPRAYGKVVRLLQNRHFPMQRSAVEELAAGAYDLESHEVEAVVDYALEQGKFVENRDLLERPDS